MEERTEGKRIVRLPRNLHSAIIDYVLFADLSDRIEVVYVENDENDINSGLDGLDEETKLMTFAVNDALVDLVSCLCASNGTVTIPDYRGPNTVLQLSLYGGKNGAGLDQLGETPAGIVGLLLREYALNMLEARLQEGDLVNGEYKPHLMRIQLNRSDHLGACVYDLVIEAFGSQDIDTKKLESKYRSAIKMRQRRRRGRSGRGFGITDAVVNETRNSKYRGLGTSIVDSVHDALGVELPRLEVIKAEIDEDRNLVCYLNSDGGRLGREVGAPVSMPVNIEIRLLPDERFFVEGTRSTFRITGNQLRNLEYLLDNLNLRPLAIDLVKKYVGGTVGTTIQRIYAEQMLLNRAKGEVALPGEELEFWGQYLDTLDKKTAGSGEKLSILLVGNDTGQLSEILYAKYGEENVDISVVNPTFSKEGASEYYVGPVEFLSCKKKYDLILCPSLQRSSPFPKNAIKRMIELMAEGGVMCAGVGWDQAIFNGMVEDYTNGSYTNLELQQQRTYAKQLEIDDVDRMLLPGILAARGLDVEKYTPLLEILHVNVRDFNEYVRNFQDYVYNSGGIFLDDSEEVDAITSDIRLVRRISGASYLPKVVGEETKDYLVVTR